MHFLDELWAGARPIYLELVRHPFYDGLRKGNLPEHIFTLFLQQDALYLKEDARAFRLLSGRMDNKDEADFLLRLANEGIANEEEMQRTYFRSYNLNPAREMIPGLRSYVRYLLLQAEDQPVAFALAALLPCYWFFREVGVYAWKHALPDNPYQTWLDTYADEDYEKQTEQLKQLTMKYAGGSKQAVREEMKFRFLKSCRYELAFADELLPGLEGNPGGHHHSV